MKRRVPKKIILWTAAGTLLLAAVCCPGGKGRIEVETETIVPGELEERIPATGVIHPAVEVKLAPEVSGEIVEIFFKEGDAVAEGDAVLRIRQDQYISQVDKARASLGSMRAQLNRQKAELRQAQLDHDRDNKLYALNAISAAEFQASKTGLEIARNSLNAAEYAFKSGEAQLREAMENLQKTTVYAPMSGIISRMNVERGEIVVGTSQMAGTELCRISDFSRMEIEVNVGENDVVRISPGDKVEVEVDAYPERKFKGFVTYMANSARNIDGRFDQVRNFAVRIEILPDSSRFLPGMSASVSIITETRHDCLTVPIGSISYKNRESAVWVVMKGGRVERRMIDTGIQGIERMEVRSGLEPGETIVTGPPEALGGLSDGKKIKS